MKPASNLWIFRFHIVTLTFEMSEFLRRPRIEIGVDRLLMHLQEKQDQIWRAET